jgi:hypothetical protein
LAFGCVLKKGAKVHTDEYEISIQREMILCGKAIKRLGNAINSREKQYGMKTEALLLLLEQDRPTKQNDDFLSWREDHMELQVWRKRLRDYEDALEMVKEI